MKDILKILGTWKFWKELIFMTVAMLIAAAAGKNVSVSQPSFAKLSAQIWM